MIVAIVNKSAHSARQTVAGDFEQVGPMRHHGRPVFSISATCHPCRPIHRLAAKNQASVPRFPMQADVM